MIAAAVSQYVALEASGSIARLWPAIGWGGTVAAPALISQDSPQRRSTAAVISTYDALVTSPANSWRMPPATAGAISMRAVMYWLESVVGTVIVPPRKSAPGSTRIGR